MHILRAVIYDALSASRLGLAQTGNMARVLDLMRMPSGEKQYNGYRGPATISIRGASISGIT